MLETKTTLDTLEAAWPEVTEGQLSVDVFETDDAIVVQSAIAGISPDDLDIYINPDMLTIRGKRARDARATDATMHYEECFWGTFSRTIVLPTHVRSDESEAELKDGILTITMPKETNTGNTVKVMKG